MTTSNLQDSITMLNHFNRSNQIYAGELWPFDRDKHNTQNKHVYIKSMSTCSLKSVLDVKYSTKNFRKYSTSS